MKVTYKKLLDKLKRDNITQKEFKTNVGYSDHTLGIEIPLFIDLRFQAPP